MSLLEPVFVAPSTTTGVTEPESEATQLGESMPFNVVVLYETAAAARRAIGMVSRLVTLSDNEFTVKPILWRFDLLEYPRLAQAAARDVLGADLLVLATNQTKSLPADAQRWLDGCVVGHRGERPATVGLFGPDDDWSILS